MEVGQAIRERRSIRQYQPGCISKKILKKLVEGARLAPSAANLQPLKYLVVDDSSRLRKVFPALRWAAYISPAGDPAPGRRPRAYIMVLVDKRIRETNYQWDVGAAVQNILLGAWEEGIGSCWLLSVNRPRLRKILALPQHFLIDSVVALGYPAEQPEIVSRKRSVRYWKDKKQVLHVPKRGLGEVLFWNSF